MMRSIHSAVVATSILLVLLLSSCATTYKSATSHTTDIVATPIVQHPLVVELDIEETKVEGKFEGNNVTMEYAKNMAIKNALDAKGYDVLVEPYFLVEETGTRINVTVKGYPAKYKNFHVPTLEDSILLGLKQPVAQSDDSVIHVINLKTSASKTPSNTTPSIVHYPSQVSAYNVNSSLLKSDAYLKMQRKSKRQIITGSAFIVTCLVVSIFGRDIYERNDRIWTLSAGSGLAFTGGILLPVGVANRIKAGKMLRTNSLALVPKLDMQTKSVQLGLTYNF